MVWLSIQKSLPKNIWEKPAPKQENNFVDDDNIPVISVHLATLNTNDKLLIKTT